MGNSWPAEDVEKLKELWLDGHSSSTIARMFGNKYTHNGIMGKVHRLNLPIRDTTGRARTIPTRSGKPRLALSTPDFPIEPLKIIPDLTAPDPLTDEHGAFITVLNAKDSHCRAPSGDSALGTFRYCGAQVEKGSYCAFHRQRFFTPATPYHKRGAA